MADFEAPIDDFRFLMNDVFDMPSFWAQTPALAETIDRETADAMLVEGAKICAEVVAPLLRVGDEQGCTYQEGGVVKTAPGYKEAYQTYSEGGWGGLSGNPQYGGMGMPKTLAMYVDEMLSAADISFQLFPMLTAGACLAINQHASDELKQTYLPKMYSGEWTGSMCLTEPHAGSDLGIIRTKALDNGDGSYAISGTKIFITGGEQDLTDNIIHLVLAKLPDAPIGSKGISLFLVPKFMVNADGSLGERNAVVCGSIEHKMGIKGSSTCVMNFDGATGYLVGEINRGLAAMFTMMNYERLMVGLQGLGASERSYQNARIYAKERLQGRGPHSTLKADKADPIIEHADVRRMLLLMRSLTEGGRCFATYVAKQLDLSKYAEDADVRAAAEAMVALLTPVTKSFCTDRGLEICVNGQQIFGGHGFIREWGQEQLVRDVRITQIYEGTNGIQAMDLLGRKVLANQGASLELFLDEIRAFIAANADNSALTAMAAALSQAVDCLSETSAELIARAADDANLCGAAAVNYQDLFGYVAYGYMWLMMAQVAQGQSGDFATRKIALARFYFDQLLPRIYALRPAITSGSESVMALDEALF